MDRQKASALKLESFFTKKQDIGIGEETSLTIIITADIGITIHAVDLEYWNTSSIRRRSSIPLFYSVIPGLEIAASCLSVFQSTLLVADIINRNDADLYVSNELARSRLRTRIKCVSYGQLQWKGKNLRKGIVPKNCTKGEDTLSIRILKTQSLELAIDITSSKCLDEVNVTILKTVNGVTTIEIVDSFTVHMAGERIVTIRRAIKTSENFMLVALATDLSEQKTYQSNFAI